MSERYQAAWLCYMNGLEIPIEGATVDFGVWQMPTATIKLSPHPLIQRLGAEDRMQVVLFFLDEFTNPDNPEFRLWGEYEITGWGYMSDTGSRSIEFPCTSQIQIFKQMYFSQLSAYKDTLVRKEEDGVAQGGNAEGTGGPVWVQHYTGMSSLETESSDTDEEA